MSAPLPNLGKRENADKAARRTIEVRCNFLRPFSVRHSSGRSQSASTTNRFDDFIHPFLNATNRAWLAL
jgi:hypothetical protein